MTELQYYWPNRYVNGNGKYLVDKSTLRPIRPTNSRPINESLALAINLIYDRK